MDGPFLFAGPLKLSQQRSPHVSAYFAGQNGATIILAGVITRGGMRSSNRGMVFFIGKCGSD